MSPYEERAWEKAITQLNDRGESNVRQLASRLSAPVAKVAGATWSKVPLHEGMEELVQKALSGLFTVTFVPAINSVRPEQAAKKVGTPFEQFHTLDLQTLDRAVPRTRMLYTGSALLQGGATAAAVTGAEVSTTVSGGATAAVAAGAIATDIAASIALMGRIVAKVAAHYGYDARLPEEEAYVLAVISFTTAGTPTAKAQALASLSRLTQQMMRNPTWKQLSANAWVKVVQTIFDQLGIKLTHRKLGQAIPVLGIAVNGGLTADMADRTFRRARDVYRLRFLAEKYGLNPADWITDQTTGTDHSLDAALAELDTDGDDLDKADR